MWRVDVREPPDRRDPAVKAAERGWLLTPDPGLDGGRRSGRVTTSTPTPDALVSDKAARGRESDDQSRKTVKLDSTGTGKFRHLRRMRQVRASLDDVESGCLRVRRATQSVRCRGMAQKVSVETVDDLDGSVTGDVTSVTFGLDGIQYDIDLSAANADQLREILARFIVKARRTGGRRKPGTGGTAATLAAVDREKSQAIRSWAAVTGYQISSRGRIPHTIVDAYEKAQAAPAESKSRKKPSSSRKRKGAGVG